MPSSAPPSTWITVRSGTPLHSTQPAAPTCQGVPLGLLGKKPRPLPEHCSTVATVSTPRVLRSAKVRERGPLTPSNATVQASRCSRMEASGAGRLLRTNKRLVGVTTLVPYAARRVSNVLLLCTIMALGSFQAATAGSGLAPAAAPDWAWACVAKPPKPRAPRPAALAASIWRRCNVFAGFTVSPLHQECWSRPVPCTGNRRTPPAPDEHGHSHGTPPCCEAFSLSANVKHSYLLETFVPAHAKLMHIRRSQTPPSP